MRKLISFLLIVMLLLTNITFVSAEAASQSEAVSILEKLEVLDQNYVSADSMSRANFVKMISNIFRADNNDYSHFKYFSDVPSSYYAVNDINKIASYGFIKENSGGAFKGDEAITFDQAAAILVRMLGYEIAAENSGGYPVGYNAIGAGNGLFKGISLGKATSDNLVQMVYNALDIEVLEQTNYGQDSGEFKKSEDKTILSGVLNIYKYKGVLNSVGKVALAGKYAVGDENAMINEQVFNINVSSQPELLDLIGHEVTGYFTERDSEYTLLFCTKEDSSEELVINLKDIISIDSNEIKYKDEDEEEASVNIIAAPYVIYNNRATGSIPELSGNGTIKLIGNGGAYDRMIIKKYDTYLVNSVSTDNHMISTKYMGAMLPELKDTEQYAILAKDGSPLTLDSLKEWDVLSIARSEGDEFIEIIASENTVNGKIEEIIQGDNSEDFKLVVNGKEYGLTEEYYNYTKDSEGYFKIDEQGVFYLDKDEKIAGYSKEMSESTRFGYLLKMIQSQDVDKTPMARILTSSGAMTDFEIKMKSGKITVDENQIDPAVFIKNKTGSDGQIGELISYRQDSDGRITKIETATDQPRDGLYKFPITSGNYRKAQRTFSSKVIMAEKPLVFVVPKEDLDNEKRYSIKDLSYFSNDTDYSDLSIYGYVKDRMIGDIIVRKRDLSETLNASTGIAMVEKFSKVINSEGNSVDKAYLLKDKKEIQVQGMENTNLQWTTRDPDDPKNPESGKMANTQIGKGDVVRYTTLDGEVPYLQLLFHNPDNPNDLKDPAKLHTLYKPGKNPSVWPSSSDMQYKVGIGRVLKRDGNVIKFEYISFDSTSTTVEYYIIGNANIQVYDSSKPDGNEIRVGDINDIRDVESYGDNASIIFLHSRYTEPKSLMIYN